jgi:hypothetical protein
MAPSATMMMFSLCPASLAPLNFLHNFSGQSTIGGNSGMKTKSASDAMAATRAGWRCYQTFFSSSLTPHQNKLERSSLPKFFSG